MSIGDIATEIGCSAGGVYTRLPGELRAKVARKSGFLKKSVGDHLDPRAIARRTVPVHVPCGICGQPSAERHHLDENIHNNHPDNLLSLCVVCHNAFHYGTTPLRVYPSRIRSIEPVGPREVFDLEVESPNHNFVAEHFVVHNCEIKLHVRVPMDCWRQWIRHRTANVNEYSTRYSEAIDATQATAPDQWRLQATANKQGSAGTVDAWPVGYELAENVSRPAEWMTPGSYLTAQEEYSQSIAREVYEERLAFGVAREQARKDLPLSTYTEAYWKCDLRNVLGFLALRLDGHAQQEIRSYADIIGREIVAKLFPLAWEAFLDYSLNAMTLTSPEIVAITSRSFDHIENRREREECREKMVSLGLLAG
jgi:thymidylate synthase (FAD)